MFHRSVVFALITSKFEIYLMTNIEIK